MLRHSKLELKLIVPKPERGFRQLLDQPNVKWALLLCVSLLVLLFIPVIMGIVLLLNFGAVAIVTGLQFYSASLPEKKVPTVKPDHKPFVSIHIPTHNEPPELVCKTLDALVELDYENYEVIVLDNNTHNPNVWLPVQDYCERLGPRFRFSHVDDLLGYKAGALNVCYKLSSPETEFILVIDADYKVHPELLSTSLGYFSDERIALVQFPQSYYNAHSKNLGLSDEYEHFFQVYMNMANCLNCVLSTGTVSVIRKKSLLEVGLWSDRTITEDVDLGLRLHEAGYQGVYVPKPLGKGLMPTDLKSLRQQRERWAYGNTQTFFNFLGMSKRNLSTRQLTGIVTQLTAWVNFLLIPIMALVLTSIATLVQHHPLHMPIAMVGVTTIWFYLITKLAFFMFAFNKKGKSLKQALYAYMVHLGLVWEGSGSWMRYLIRDNLGFNRTNKFEIAGPLKDLMPGLMFSLMMLISGILFLLSNALVSAILSILAAPVFMAVFYTHLQTQNTYEFIYGKAI
ncbi:MAG: glycosyltransferase family 2 protein [Balneolales bacterium]